MSKAIDREVQARNNRVMRSKLYGKTVDVNAWKSHKESWKENLERYEKIKYETPYDELRHDLNKRKQYQIILNDMDICRLNIDICEMQIKIAELQEHNIKLKTNLM